MLPQALDSIFGVIYPQACLSCGGFVARRADGVACANCWQKTRFFDGSQTCCVKCSAVLSEKPSIYQPHCHRCDAHHYDAARAAGFYEKALAASLIHLKNEPFIAKTLRLKLVEVFETTPFVNADLIVPVPLSKKRHIERGFNQAELLGKVIAAEYGIRLDALSFTRRRHASVHRAAMDRRAREMSVENAFEVKRQKFIEGRKIVLIDDVLTSGATTSFCAKALKAKGADEVNIFTAARAI